MATTNVGHLARFVNARAWEAIAASVMTGDTPSGGQGPRSEDRGGHRMDDEPAPLLIPADIHDAMVAHCLREAPLECCGLLGGIANRVSSIHPLRNTSASGRPNS